MKNHAIFAVAVLLAAAACGGPETSNTPAGTTPTAQVIAVDGSSTVFPITEAVAEEFQETNRSAKVTVGLSGTGGGFQKFCRGETVISNASRPITETEIEACGKASIQYIELPVAYDGIAIVVNPKNTWATNMTVPELRRIWEPAAQGKVLRWSQVRPGWPEQELHLFGAGVDSGTFDYFTEVINGKTRASRGDYTSSEDDNILVQGVAGDQNSLGYMGLAYYEENRDKLRVVPVDDGQAENGAGPVAPSPETVRNGTYRPLSRPMFIYVSAAALARPEVEQFVRFYLDSAAGLIKEVGYVPLTDAEQQLVRQRFANKTIGTMFAGGTAADPKITLEQRLTGTK